jgi:hypothetical protein
MAMSARGLDEWGQSDRERTGRHVSPQANLNWLGCDVPGRCPNTATTEPHIELSG